MKKDLLIDWLIDTIFIQMTYATYIGVSSKICLNFPNDIKEQIEKKINPPYEDLFDRAEQYALTILVRPWLNLIMKEKQQFEAVSRFDVGISYPNHCKV